VAVTGWEGKRVHRLVFGHSWCGVPAGMPDEWPAGHAWSSYWHEVSCPDCLKTKSDWPREGAAPPGAPKITGGGPPKPKGG
jgi:hypothetical protein